MKTASIKHQNYKLEDYGGLCAMTKVMIDRPGVGLWNYTLMFEVIHTPRGVDNHGSRASGDAEAACITSARRPIEQNPVIEIGSTIFTHFGTYRVEWYRPGNYDHLRLVPVE